MILSFFLICPQIKKELNVGIDEGFYSRWRNRNLDQIRCQQETKIRLSGKIQNLSLLLPIILKAVKIIKYRRLKQKTRVVSNSPR